MTLLKSTNNKLIKVGGKLIKIITTIISKVAVLGKMCLGTAVLGEEEGDADG